MLFCVHDMYSDGRGERRIEEKANNHKICMKPIVIQLSYPNYIALSTIQYSILDMTQWHVLSRENIIIRIQEKMERVK